MYIINIHVSFKQTQPIWMHKRMQPYGSEAWQLLCMYFFTRSCMYVHSSVNSMCRYIRIASSPVPHKPVNDVSVVHIHDQYRVELFTVILGQLRPYLHRVKTQYHTCTCFTYGSSYPSPCLTHMTDPTLSTDVRTYIHMYTHLHTWIYICMHIHTVRLFYIHICTIVHVHVCGYCMYIRICMYCISTPAKY